MLELKKWHSRVGKEACSSYKTDPGMDKSEKQVSINRRFQHENKTNLREFGIVDLF